MSAGLVTQDSPIMTFPSPSVISIFSVDRTVSDERHGVPMWDVHTSWLLSNFLVVFGLKLLTAMR